MLAIAREKIAVTKAPFGGGEMAALLGKLEDLESLVSRRKRPGAAARVAGGLRERMDERHSFAEPSSCLLRDLLKLSGRKTLKIARAGPESCACIRGF